MLKILCVSANEELRVTRNAVLETTGAKSTASSPSAALHLLANERFDLVVLCHTVAVPEALGILKQLNSTLPPVPVLLLSTSFRESPLTLLRGHHLNIHGMPAGAGPAELVRNVQMLLRSFSA